MITAMQMHGFSPRTDESYLAAVQDLAKFARRSPDTLAQALIIIPPTLFSPGVAAPFQNMVLRAQTHMGRLASGGFVIKALAHADLMRYSSTWWCSAPWLRPACA